MAGHFQSCLNIRDSDELASAIDQVISSYGEDSLDQEVLIQPMLDGVSRSGVLFTRDPNTNGPYIVINYNDTSSDTTTVTSGKSNDLKVFYHCKSCATKPAGWLARIVDLAEELEAYFDGQPLDVEFAMSGDELYLFQARPLVMNTSGSADKDEIQSALINIEQKIEQMNRPHPFLYGRRAVFGIMPDWNPAEIIGVRPRPLALSLYKELVTDNIWAYQRDNYGYKNLRSFPLLTSLLGLPYIDVRVSFNSFIPEDVNGELSEKLANYYLDQLVKRPSLHDKVEFEIVLSCYTLDIKEKLQALEGHGFSKEECGELLHSLRALTNRIIHGETGLWRQDLEKIELLAPRRDQIHKSSLDHVGKIYWLLEDCKRYGTLPFAGLARAAFIAVQILKSMVSVGILSREDLDTFMATLDTVSSRISIDFAEMSREDFLLRYGHLRPGTYDILSPRYDADPDRYFDWSKERLKKSDATGKFSLNLEQFRKIELLLKEHGLDHDVLGLFDFIKKAIEGRELAKFYFSRNLSDALTLIEELGDKYGLSLEECSFMDIRCIHPLYSSAESPLPALNESIAQGRKSYARISKLTLPPLIVEPKDVWSFHLPEDEPNFVTLKSTTGHITFADGDKAKLENSVLLIPSADPGYDWIFAFKISGLVTKYGGLNSHMAIRAGELGIPAIIGAGEALYSRIASAKNVELDCMSRQVRIL
jgi:glutamine kinase